MAGDAVADLAETGQVDEQSLLEERRKRGVRCDDVCQVRVHDHACQRDARSCVPRENAGVWHLGRTNDDIRF